MCFNHQTPTTIFENWCVLFQNGCTLVFPLQLNIPNYIIKCALICCLSLISSHPYTHSLRSSRAQTRLLIKSLWNSFFVGNLNSVRYFLVSSLKLVNHLETPMNPIAYHVIYLALLMACQNNYLAVLVLTLECPLIHIFPGNCDKWWYLAIIF